MTTVSEPGALKTRGKTGRELLIEQFLADGITYMFGNPGTVEQGFLDALEEYPQFKYVLTLQETIAVAMGDGYARAHGDVGLVQLHSGVGLGNGVGMMYQAMRGHAPLVVVAGEAGIKYDAMDAQMAADLVGIAKPVTKWATRVVDPASLLRIIRRAIKIARTPPMGPVFVALPADVLDAVIDEVPVPSTRIRTRVRPDDASLAEAAALLGAAKKPLVLMGDGITFSGAQAELDTVARLLGAPVWGVNSAEVNMVGANPLYQGTTGHMFGPDSQRITHQHDAVLIVGTYVFPEVFPALSDAFAPGTKIVHVDLDMYEIGKNHPVDIGLLGDPKVTLAALAEILHASMNEAGRERARVRARDIAEAKADDHAAALEGDYDTRNAMPLRMSRFVQELAEQLPPDALVFDEALTNSPSITRYLSELGPGQFFVTRGGSLGVGIPGAIGLQVAHPDKKVIGFTGDGGGMYTIQALWTAAHHKIPAKFVVCNNRAYKLLKLNISEYWRELDIEQHTYPHSFDLFPPELRFDLMAQSMGVASERLEKPEDAAAAIKRMLEHDGPYLIDLILGHDG